MDRKQIFRKDIYAMESFFTESNDDVRAIQKYQ